MVEGMKQSKRMVGAVTTDMYDEVLGEVDTVTDKLNKVRAELWETQDELKEAKVYKLKLKAHEKLSKKDKDTIEMLEQKIEKILKKERDTRDALDLMKKVFTRTQLKAKDDQTTIQKLEESNRLLTEENNKLLESLNIIKEELSGTKKMTEEEKDNMEKLLFENFESIEVGKKLADKLKETKRDLEKERAQQKVVQERSQFSQKRMEATTNRIAEDSATQIEEQRKEIEKLKNKLRVVEEQQEAAEQAAERAAERAAEQEPKAHGVDSSAADFFSQFGLAVCNPSLTAVAV
jgi:chromosome segregation ATPase